jgi:hypothetical protein
VNIDFDDVATDNRFVVAADEHVQVRLRRAVGASVGG